jgi:ABC-2 type transport system permease protein
MTPLAHPASLARPSLPRLVRVELRKMTDTRAGLWLLLLIALGALAAVVVTLAAGDERDQTMDRLFGICGITVAVLLPVVGLLSVTGEWTQRTALTTFTLVPARGRVIAAKLLAGCALALTSLLVCLTVAAAGNLIAGGSWSLDLSRVSGGALYMLIVMLAGLAVGLLLTRSAPAIIAYFVLPTAIGVLAETVHSLRGPSEWFNLGQATAPLGAGDMAAGDWPRLAVSVAIWIGLPLALGLLRLQRSELS